MFVTECFKFRLQPAVTIDRSDGPHRETKGIESEFIPGALAAVRRFGSLMRRESANSVSSLLRVAAIAL